MTTPTDTREGSLQALRRANSRVGHAESYLERARAERDAAVIAALDAGASQADVARVTNVSRETVRRWVDRLGIGPDGDSERAPPPAPEPKSAETPPQKRQCGACGAEWVGPEGPCPYCGYAA